MSEEEGEEKIRKFEEALENGSFSEQTRELLAGLTAREVKVLRMKFGINLKSNQSLEEVAKEFDVTRGRIRKIEEKAIKKLRDKEEDPDPDDDGPSAA